MKVSLLFAAALNLAVACPPPFNDVRFMANSTAESGTLVRNALDNVDINPNLGWYEAVSVTTNPTTVWPTKQVNGHSISLIKFCLADQAAYDAELDTLIRMAWQTWEERIGRAEDEHSHRLKLEPLRDATGFFEYCYRGRAEDKVWNDVVPKDTLVVRIKPAWVVQASATAGYKRDSVDNTPGRHELNIGLGGWSIKDFPPGSTVPMVTHELGHIFGLRHEHERQDRNKYVYFDCTKIERYQEAKAKVESDLIGPTMEHVCTEREWAQIYGFSSSQFSTEPPKSNGPQGLVTMETHQSDVYDLESIMHYDTGTGADRAAYSSNHFHGPLLAWKNGGPNFVPPTQVSSYEDLKVIPFNTKPSVLDGEAIRRLYPWTG